MNIKSNVFFREDTFFLKRFSQRKYESKEKIIVSNRVVRVKLRPFMLVRFFKKYRIGQCQRYIA